MSDSDAKRMAKLRALIEPLAQELNELESANRRAQAQSLIGKCFRYRNNYSCPKTEADYWWLYVKVTQIDQAGRLSGVSIQIDSDDKAEITPRLWIGFPLSPGYQPISASEFDAALQSFLDHVAALAKAGASRE